MNLLLTAALLQWGAFDINQTLTLETNLALSTSSSSTPLNLKKGAKLLVTDIVPLDSIRVLSYAMEVTPCPNSLRTQRSEMTIIDDLYGIELAPDCKIYTYVEWKDLEVESPFSAASTSANQ